MIDLMFGAAIALLFVRGWHRGFRREAFDLAILFAAVFFAFRFGTVVGSIVAGAAGTSSGASRLIGGLLVFGAVAAGTIVARGALRRLARPRGPGLADRAGGAVAAGLGGVLLATLLFTVLAVVPLPGATAAYLDESVVVGTLTDPAGAPQTVVGTVAGDRVVRSVLRLRDLVGERRVVVGAGEHLTIPVQDPAGPDSAAATAVFDLVNRARVAAGSPPLAWSDALAAVAASRAEAMYTAGYFGHHLPAAGDHLPAGGDYLPAGGDYLPAGGDYLPAAGTVTDWLDASGIRFTVAGENLALAATTGDAHDGLVASDSHRENILRREFRRVGIAVVPGLLGMMVVEVFSG